MYLVLTGEDERRANYLKGQAELEKRRAILEEQMRQEEESRKAKEKAEIDRQEKIRLIFIITINNIKG